MIGRNFLYVEHVIYRRASQPREKLMIKKVLVITVCQPNPARSQLDYFNWGTHSGVNLFPFAMTPSSRTFMSPANPGRFIPPRACLMRRNGSLESGEMVA